MKKIYILVLFIAMFFIIDNTLAEDFYEGEYFTTYVNKVKDNRTYYLTMQAIRDRDNGHKLVYCLEPFKFFDSSTSYRQITNSKEYELSPEQMDMIRKLTYYGFGYQPKHRVTYEWYAITQVLIWKVVDPNADIYFTNSLNGTRDDVKYQDKVNELINDVTYNRMELDLIDNYKVVYNNDLEIRLNNNYEIVDSNYNYEYNNNILQINNIKEDGYVTVREKANREYKNNEIIYDSNSAQDLYLPGTLEDKVLTINIDVIKGDITLNMFKDKETYSVDADFSNTCYGIYRDDILIQKVCASDEYSYKTEELEVGEYQVKQLSVGVGYKEDNNIYTVSINEYNLHPEVNLYNYIKSNNININKKYCDEDRCSIESKAVFEVYDSKANLVNSYITDNNGKVSFRLGYGNYEIIQVDGIDGYKFINNFNVFIDNEEQVLSYDLIDRKEENKRKVVIEEEIEDEEIIETEEITKMDEIIEEVFEEEIDETNSEECLNITPPDTGLIFVLKNNKWVKVFFNNIMDIIRRYSRFAILL